MTRGWGSSALEGEGGAGDDNYALERTFRLSQQPSTSAERYKKCRIWCRTVHFGNARKLQSFDRSKDAKPFTTFLSLIGESDK